MKSCAIAGTLALGGLFAGFVGGHPLNFKRDLVTDVVFVTETIADAIVYVDENGVPYLTSNVVPYLTSNIERVTTVPTATAASPSLSSSAPVPTLAPVEPVPTPSAPPSALTALSSSSELASFAVEPSSSAAPFSVPSPQASQPSPSASTSAPVVTPEAQQSPSSPAPEPNASSDDQFPLGITYDTYKGTSTNVQCKTPEEMQAEFEKMKDFGIVRIYGNDCGVIATAVQQAKKNNQKLMAGIYAPNQQVDEVVRELKDAIDSYNGGDWSLISLISVENERVNAHVITASDAQDTITQARQALRTAGFDGPVGAVETVPAVVDNPSICAKSDMTLVNIHAFFDPNTKAENAGDFVKSEIARVKQACPDKRVIVTESGWPHEGDHHDLADATPAAQTAAINSIRANFDHDLFLFNAFDSPWKTDDGSTYNSERFWGILQ